MLILGSLHSVCLRLVLITAVSTTVTSEASDKSRMASMTCVSKVIEHVISEIPNSINTVYVVSDACASQFQSRFVFKLFTTMHPEMNLEWHYNEAHHGKGPMDGIGGAVKNAVFRKVLSGAVKISSPKEFAEYVNHVSEVHSLYFTDEIPPGTRRSFKCNCNTRYFENPWDRSWFIETWRSLFEVLFLKQ